MSVRLLDIDAATYEPHPLHSAERVWSETNCYVDLWIEVLHALGFDPLAAAAFTLSVDFEGDQWTFFKFPPEDLRTMYGIDVNEMNVWQPLEAHIVEQLELGRLLTVEADSWYLPDTAGVSYQIDHVKSALVPQFIDTDARRLGYFHNAGYFELSGDDYDAVLRRPEAHHDPRSLPPYVELVKLDMGQSSSASVVERAVELTRSHLDRRPATNPVQRMRKRLTADLEWLTSQTLETFHRWAFGFCRQAGSSAELAATYVEWLAANEGGPVAPAAASLRELSNAAKTLQFNLARAVRGRTVDVEPVLDAMELHWDSAMAVLDAHYG
jgi:hypothetical protein